MCGLLPGFGSGLSANGVSASSPPNGPLGRAKLLSIKSLISHRRNAIKDPGTVGTVRGRQTRKKGSGLQWLV